LGSRRARPSEIRAHPCFSFFERLQKRFALLLQAFFQSLRAMAVGARPRFGAVFVPAILAVVRVPDAQQFKVFLPVRPFLGQGCGAKTGLDPVRDAVIAHACLLQVVNIFVTGNRALAKRAVGDGLQQALFTSGFSRGL
jgi:hypothetical protein